MKSRQLMMARVGIITVMLVGVWPLSGLFAAGTSGDALIEAQGTMGSNTDGTTAPQNPPKSLMHAPTHRMQRSSDRRAADVGAEFSPADLKKQLGLTDEQAAKLRTLHLETMKETILQGAKLKVAALELRDLFRNGTLDESAIEKKVKELESLRSDLTLAHTRALLKAEAFLTPEQFGRYRTLMVRRMELWTAGDQMTGTMRMAHRGAMGAHTGRSCPSHAQRPV
jgi:Spy/CpxP family protein refolding chaperone